MSLFDKLKKKLPVFTIVSGNTVPVYNYPECMLVERIAKQVNYCAGK